MLTRQEPRLSNRYSHNLFNRPALRALEEGGLLPQPYVKLPWGSIRSIRLHHYLLIGLLASASEGYLSAQDIFSTRNRAVELLDSEETTKTELERVKSLPVSKNQSLNLDALHEANNAINSYTSFLGQDTQLGKADLSVEKARALKAVDSLIPLGARCGQPAGSDEVTKALFELRHSFATVEGVVPSFDLDFDFPGSSASLSAGDAKLVNDLRDFFKQAPKAVCGKLSTEPQYGSTLRTLVSDSFALMQRQLDARKAQFRDRQPRAKQLSDAWRNRKEKLQQALEEQSAPAGVVANYLPWIIVTFCIFALLIFLLLRWFERDVQMELVASGQMIQFATVMVILIVVCVLGISKILAENVLGTLLGGIGGYVLAQGVGRAAERRGVLSQGVGPSLPGPPAPPPG